MKHCVYIYRESEFGTARYVGKGSSKRAYSHLKNTHNRVFKAWLKKHTPVIQLVEVASDDKAIELEVFLIAEIGRKDLSTGPLFNLTAGGEGTCGWVPSAETRAKISAANAGNTYCVGRAVSVETKAKISRANKGNQSWVGKTHTDDAKAKISAAKTGKKLGPKTAEHKAKIAASHKGKTHSAETRAKMSVAQKARQERARQGLF